MKWKLLFAILTTCLFLGACSKDGEQGPAGPMGNADVTVINYESRTFTGLTEFILPGMTQTRLDSSMILMYYNPSTEVAGAWYPCPGIGSGGSYETRYLVYASPSATGTSLLSVRVQQPGSSAVYGNSLTFRKTRVFVVPAGKYVNGRGSTAPDYTDYNAVCDYYGIVK